MNAFTKTKSQVCRTANALRRKGMNASEAMTRAWVVVKLKEKMRNGVADFVYIKKDGSVRIATGTLDPVLTNYTPKGSGADYSPAYVRYYDLEKKAFRQFAAASLAA